MNRSQWVSARLAECVASVSAGVSVNSDDRPSGPGEIGVLKTSAVSGGYFKADENKVVTKWDRARVAESIVRGSVLFSRMNTPQLVGESCYVEADNPSLFLPDRLWQIRVEPSRVDARWLSYALLEPRVAAEIKGLATGTSGSMKNIAKHGLLGIRILIPPLKEQRRIAEILDTLDVRIRTSEQIVAKLETVKIAIIEDQLGTVKLYRQLREIADLQVGYAFSSLDFLDGDEGVRLLRGENVGYGGPDWSALRSLKSSVAARFRQYELAVGDIIIGMDRTFTKSGMRLSTITSDDLPSLLVQRVGRFIPQSVSQKYLQCVLESAAYRRSLNACQKGMDIPHLSRDEILDQLVPVAGSKVQRRVVESTSLVRNRVEAEVATSRRLRMLKAGLMSDLLTGRVRVPIDVAS